MAILQIVFLGRIFTTEQWFSDQCENHFDSESIETLLERLEWIQSLIASNSEEYGKWLRLHWNKNMLSIVL